MTPLITPEWEYHAGDPEIEELLAQASGAAGGFDALPEPQRARRGRPTEGFRFGTGSPDRFDGFLAREPARPQRRERGRALCPGCRALFVKPRPESRYCSRQCSPRPGRPRERPDSCVCGHCGTDFAPKEPGHVKYCSRRCANRANRNCLKGKDA